MGCYFSPPGDHSDSGIEPVSPGLQVDSSLLGLGSLRAFFSKFSRGSPSMGGGYAGCKHNRASRTPIIGGYSIWAVHAAPSFHGPGEIPMMLFYNGLASVLIKASKGLFNIRHKERGFGLLCIDPACGVK